MPILGWLEAHSLWPSHIILCSCQLFHAHTVVAGGALTLAKPCYPMELSAISCPYWGGWRRPHVAILKACNCQLFHAHTGVAGARPEFGPIIGAPCNNRRFQRVNPESAQLSAISRPYWGG